MYDFKNKKSNVKALITNMLTKVNGMFEYSGLPNSIPQETLEKLLQTKGKLLIYKNKGDIYSLPFTYSGELDAYGKPTEILLVNPYLKLSETIKVKDAIIIKNDGEELGLLPIIERYSTVLVENEINMYMLGVNSRMVHILSAGDARTKAGAETYIDKIVDGEFSVVYENSFYDGLKVQSSSTNQLSGLNNLIEYNQYIKANLFNELGLSASHNMKRERLITGEIEQDKSQLYPLPFDMFKHRLEAIEKINSEYGLNITVKFGKAWDDFNESDLNLDGDGSLTQAPEINSESVLEPELENDKELEFLITEIISLNISDELLELLGDNPTVEDAKTVIELHKGVTNEI